MEDMNSGESLALGARKRGGFSDWIEGTDLEHSITFFVDSVSDPHNPKHCGLCLTGAFLASSLGEPAAPPKPGRLSSQAAATILAYTRSPELWNAVMRFLFTKRTKNQTERMLDRLAVCSCDMGDETVAAFHFGGERMGTLRSMQRCMDEMGNQYPLRQSEGEIAAQKFTVERCTLIIMLFCWLVTVVEGCGATTFALRNSHTWPFQPSDLLPFGPDRFILGVIHWHQFVPDSTLFDLVSLTMMLCQSLVIPSIIKYKFAHLVVDVTKQYIDQTLIDIRKSPYPVDARKRVVTRWNTYVSAYIVFFDTSFRRMPLDVGADIIRGRQTKAMQLASLILYLEGDQRMPRNLLPPTQRRCVTFIGDYLFRNLALFLEKCPDIPVHPAVEEYFSASCKLLNSETSLWHRLAQSAIHVMQIVHLESRCSADGCPNSMQAIGPEFRRCQGCQVSPYCGPECQKAAWRDGKYPHKAICHLLHRLIEQGGGDKFFFADARLGHSAKQMGTGSNTKAIQDKWLKAEVSREDIDAVRNWGDTSKVVGGLTPPCKIKYTPGYDEYNYVIAKYSAEKRGPKGAWKKTSETAISLTLLR